MGTLKTTGVYVAEDNVYPNSVVVVPTAVPAFIGYTERVAKGNESLLNKPIRINSMDEFHAYFGGASIPMFTLVEINDVQEAFLKCRDRQFVVKQTGIPFILYYQMLMFFGNGGGPCYIVSIGDYTVDKLDINAFKDGIDALLKEEEPTMILCPDAVKITDKDLYYNLQQAMLNHCGHQMRNRIAILDVFEGYRDRKDPSGDVIDEFRNKIGNSYLNYGVVYYPWINTSVVAESDLSLLNIDAETLKIVLEEELNSLDSQGRKINKKLVDKVNKQMNATKRSTLHTMLMKNSLIYRDILKEMGQILNLLPPSVAMAGIYTMVDNTSGVWKAPANVVINQVVSPAVDISSEDQTDLNAPLIGKAINAIRWFEGEGIKVWGACTLDGNSLDWRYINTCRTMIMLEQSIKNALHAYACEPNDAQTWLIVRCMIESFLTGIWKCGGLAGTAPSEAFKVHVGLGNTMTRDDILAGILRIRILVAITRPSEFIEIAFQYQIQEG